MTLLIATLEHAVSRRMTHSLPVEIGRAVVASVLTLGVAVAAFLLHLNLGSAVAILLLVTVLASIHGGIIQATAISFVAVGCLDFFFTVPVFEFSVHSSENWVALATFEVTALLVSRLSWKERLHAREQELQRQGISKLYQLSNAILLVDGRTSNLEQLSALLREFFSIRSASLWVAPEGDAAETVPVETDAAYQAFRAGKARDSIEGGWSHRILRLGTLPIGGMALEGWEVEPALADAAASLIAVAIERARSAQKENRAEAARNTEQLRTAVLDALAHGFKTPLTAIQTASSGLLAIGRLDEPHAELVGIIDHEVAMLANLTTRLLRTAALDAREIRVRATSIVLLPLLERIVAEQDAETFERIRLFADGSFAEVRADEQLLELAFAQLMDNAIKYSLVGTPIEVTVMQDEAATQIAIVNQGEPIRSADLGRIFERYHRGSQAGHGPTGTGLGLSIVRKIAEAHGGRAWATCEGSTIRIVFSLMGGRGVRNG